MVVAVWSVKGGTGASSVAALLALAQVERADDVVLVDLCGELPAVLGLDDALLGPGITDWCSMPSPDPEVLRRVEIEARPGLHLVPRGDGEIDVDSVGLVEALYSHHRTVIIDCGMVRENSTFLHGVISASTTSLLVVRECFLNLRAAQRTSLVPTGVVVIKEPSRRLGRADVETATNAPVVGQLAFDPAIAQSIDAGLVRARLPRKLLRSMGRVLSDGA